MKVKTDKIEEAWGYLKERMSNPLVYSFIGAWMILNWRIVVGLVWYDADMLEAEGCNSFNEFIIYNLESTSRSFWYPLLIAISYTLFFPVIKNLVTAFNSWNYSWGNKWSLSLMNKGKIGVDKYLKLRKVLEEKEKILEDRIEQESDTYNKYQETLNEKNNLINEKEEVDQKLKELSLFLKQVRIKLYKYFDTNEVLNPEDLTVQLISNQVDKKKEIEQELTATLQGLKDTNSKLMKDIKWLNGERALERLEGIWEKSTPISGDTIITFLDSIQIKGNKYLIKSEGKDYKEYGEITFTSFNPKSQMLKLILKIASRSDDTDQSMPSELIDIYELSVDGDWDLLRGKENGRTTVEYSRIKSSRFAETH